MANLTEAAQRNGVILRGAKDPSWMRFVSL